MMVCVYYIYSDKPFCCFTYCHILSVWNMGSKGTSQRNTDVVLSFFSMDSRGETLLLMPKFHTLDKPKPKLLTGPIYKSTCCCIITTCKKFPSKGSMKGCCWDNICPAKAKQNFFSWCLRFLAVNCDGYFHNVQTASCDAYFLCLRKFPRKKTQNIGSWMPVWELLWWSQPYSQSLEYSDI